MAYYISDNRKTASQSRFHCDLVTGALSYFIVII